MRDSRLYNNEDEYKPIRFESRRAPWHSVGSAVNSMHMTFEEIMSNPEINWKVEQQPLMTSDGTNVPGYYANVRSDTKAILGVVTRYYQVVQHKEMFGFLENISSRGLLIAQVGCVYGGRQVWLRAEEAELREINGEKIKLSIFFVAGHDGDTAINCFVVPLRLVCTNGMTAPVEGASRDWRISHTGNVEVKLSNLNYFFEKESIYAEQFCNCMERFHKIKLSDNDVDELIESLLPEDDEMSLRKEKILLRHRHDLRYRYDYAPDLQHMDNSAYRFFNAVTDFADHNSSKGNEESISERKFLNAISGHRIIDNAYRLLDQM